MQEQHDGGQETSSLGCKETKRNAFIMGKSSCRRLGAINVLHHDFDFDTDVIVVLERAGGLTKSHH